MKKLKTKDSLTFFNSRIKQAYHPMDGGLKHAGFYAEHAKGKVLDIGFGLGYIAYACVKKAIKNKERIEITGLELDKGILGKIKGIDLDCEYEFIFVLKNTPTKAKVEAATDCRRRESVFYRYS